ncbi:Ion channel, partial [Ancylostoma caninum]
LFIFSYKFNSKNFRSVVVTNWGKLVATSYLLIALTLATVLGGISFLEIERNYKDDEYHVKCIDEAEKETSLNNSAINMTEFVYRIRKCFHSNSQIKTPAVACYFAWTLYTTIGFGDIYPHSRLGWIGTTIYTFVTVPLYIALKAEFGEFLSRGILWVAQKLRSLCVSRKKSCLRRTHRTVEKPTTPPATYFPAITTNAMPTGIMACEQPEEKTQSDHSVKAQQTPSKLSETDETPLLTGKSSQTHLKSIQSMNNASSATQLSLLPASVTRRTGSNNSKPSSRKTSRNLQSRWEDRPHSKNSSRKQLSKNKTDQFTLSKKPSRRRENRETP